MIKIQNIYYMLAYAFQILQEQGYKSLGEESFQNTADLLSAILVRGVSIQLKRGLGKAYVERTEPLSGLRGKIDISNSIKEQSMLKQQLICTYDSYSVNSYPNQILKTTMELLLHADIPVSRKKALRNLLLYFREADTLQPGLIRWNLQYNRNNQTYRMLISVCYLVVKGLLQTQADGKHKMMDFLDEQRMCRLYEKFILEYFRKEYPEFNPRSSRVDWALDDDFDFMLPNMQTDVVLKYEERILIIDAKYYGHNTQVQYDKHSIHSGNLYQIFTYVKNEAQHSQNPKNVSGMLLYAMTDEEIQPKGSYLMSGNRISVDTLDLSGEFSRIQEKLDQIASSFIRS